MMLTKKSTQKDTDAAHALNAALRFLTSREYSKYELYTKLCVRYSAEAAKEAIRKCIENGWQSEERYTAMLFEHFVNRGYGPSRFILEARKKRIGAEYYEELLSAQDWTACAYSYLKRKLKLEASPEYQERQKILSSLYRRGFSQEDCIAALELYLDELGF